MTEVLAEAQRKLPIFKHREEILESVKRNNITIVSGDTGCGKTTQVPRYILESGLGKGWTIGVTQPRRIAAVSVSERVAFELGEPIGGAVGYEIRFESRLSLKTSVKFMTEGILLREFALDSFLKRYSVVIVDEAHERGLNCDLLLGLLRQLSQKRREFRLVIMSATLETEKLCNYFGGKTGGLSLGVIEVLGRFHPIEIFNLSSSVESYLDAALNCILQLHAEEEERGDVLVFMTGQVV